MERIGKVRIQKFIHILGAIVATASLVFALMINSFVDQEDLVNVALFLALAYLSLTFSKVLLIFQKKNRLEHIVNIVFSSIYFVLAIMTFIWGRNLIIIQIGSVIYLFTVITNRVIRTLLHLKPRTIVKNVILILFLLFISIGFFGEVATTELTALILVQSLLIAVVAFMDVIAFAFAGISREVLLKIIRKTYVSEILLGLLALTVATSFILYKLEPGIVDFWDAIWYCFAVITTIGFGDFTAVTLLGRILTVILGVYGIIVVALITSVIVNFYNETKMIRTDDDDDDISKNSSEDKDDKNDKEEVTDKEIEEEKEDGK